MNALETMSRLVRVRDATVERASRDVRRAALGHDRAQERLELSRSEDEACRHAEDEARAALLAPRHGRLNGAAMLGGLARLDLLADRRSIAGEAVDLARKEHAAALAELALERGRLARRRGELRKVQALRDRLQREARIRVEIRDEQADAESIELRSGGLPSDEAAA